MEGAGYQQLQLRLFQFAVKTIYLVRKLPRGKEYDVISYQLIKSATSVGANYEEAQGSVSRADFANKIGISLKEIHETSYWIRIVIAISREMDAWKSLEMESDELMKILGKIYSKTSVKR